MSSPPLSLKDAAAAHQRPAWLPQLTRIVGAGNVHCEIHDLWVHSRDRSPFAVFHVRNGNVPFTLPSAVVRPADTGEIAELMTFARRHRIAVIPYGAGSGVLGGTLPLANELIIDMKRLNRIVEINETDRTVTVQAGMNGGQFEQALNERGFTSGHLPQSLHMSTVGGWLACRGAGQNSTRYGKIEDMVLGLEVVLPDGRRLRVRPAARRATGPSLKDLFVGSEGTFGILTEATLRIWRLPEARHGVVLAFPDLQAGFDAMRTVMQSELRPAIVRLYDSDETAHRTRDLAPFAEKPILAILEFSGPRRLADVERDLALEICASFGASRADDAPYRAWLAQRFISASVPWHARDCFVDTIEITGSWSALPGMYDAMRECVRAISADIDFGAHWSHAYPEGACQYMTVRLPAIGEEKALTILGDIWNRIQKICIEKGGSISHHHGVGLFRNPWMGDEMGVGLELLREIKARLDPDNLIVPGKLGLGEN